MSDFQVFSRRISFSGIEICVAVWWWGGFPILSSASGSTRSQKKKKEMRELKEPVKGRNWKKTVKVGRYCGRGVGGTSCVRSEGLCVII